MQKIIGITGSMGSGKSTIARMMKSLEPHAAVLDADEIAKKFLKKPDLARLIGGLFPEAQDSRGRVNPQKLADAVFSNNAKLKTLNSLMHPFVVRAIRAQISKLDEKYVILDVPLLVEAGMLDALDFLVIVDAKKGSIITRSKFSKKDLERRTKKQMPFAKKKSLAIKTLGKGRVIVIDNSGTRNATKEKVRTAWKLIR